MRFRIPYVVVGGILAALPFAFAPASAQPGIKPLLTQPAERVVITQGFRDYLGIAINGPTVIAGAPNAAGGLHAIDATTKAVKWTFRPGAPASPMVSTKARIVGNTVLARFGEWQGAVLVAVSLANGKELWRAPATVPAEELALDDGLVFVLVNALDENRRGLRILSAVDVQTGKEHWKATYQTEKATTPVASNGMVYLAVGGDNALLALDAKTGQERWRYPLARDFPSRLLVDASGVYGGDNWLFGVNRETGRELFRPVELRRDIDGKPQMFSIERMLDAGDVVVAVIRGNRYNFIVGFDKSRGTMAWEHPWRSRASRPSIALAGNMVYFDEQTESSASGDPSGPHVLRAMDLTSRRIVWSYTRTTHPEWAFADLVPFDGGLWATNFATLLKLQ